MPRSSAWRAYRPGRAPAAAAAPASARTVASLTILGLDPGSRATGYGVVVLGPGGCRYVASGAIRATGSDFAARLQQIYQGVAALVAEYAPAEIAIERVFVNRNPDSALKLGQARGAALSATFASHAPIHEYSPRAVKLGVVGTGAAEKAQVQRMVGVLLGLDGRLGSDAADALAIALCHAHGRGLRLALAAAGGAA
ncbi:MAG: crossover junction endodeoxyribonuclease RuvC [Proteobacteria bacterium]|nr:crossover junction endodeoxyribonuclease RuvC [Pseudomonadota bacterium]